MTLTHLDEKGNAVMVDVTDKAVTHRTATAEGRIAMSAPCYEAVKAGAVQKGDVLSVARVAGIMAVKRTAELIPLCHTLMITKAAVEFTLLDDNCEVAVRCTVCCEGKTGVEMEALTGASVALLTVYDMAKALDRRMVIRQVRLLEKGGGKSGHFVASEAQP